MSANPLFVVDRATLLKKLRFSNSTLATDADVMVDEAIVGVRLRFFERLGQARIDVINLTTYVDAPTTQAQYLRTLASNTEIKMVRAELLVVFPQAWMDASGDILKRWNEEAPFRERSSREIENELERLNGQIEKALSILAGDDIDASTVQVFDGTPEEETPSLGDTLERLSSMNWNLTEG